LARCLQNNLIEQAFAIIQCLLVEAVIKTAPCDRRMNIGREAKPSFFSYLINFYLNIYANLGMLYILEQTS